MPVSILALVTALTNETASDLPDATCLPIFPVNHDRERDMRTRFSSQATLRYAAFGALVALAVLWPSLASAAPQPLSGTVIALRSYRDTPSGPILTEVTLATSDGRATFTMDGGVVDGLGMLTSEYTELTLADRIAVIVERKPDGTFDALQAPVLLTSGSMSALAVTDYIYDGTRWDHTALPVAWRFNSANAPAGALAAIQAAADTWENDPGSAIDYTYAGATSAAPGTADSVNSVGWRQNVSGGSLATCVIWFYPTKSTLGYNQIIEFDIDFNRAYAWATNGASSAYDIQSIAVHEFGHSLHLSDLHDATPTSAQEVMNGYIAAGTLQRVLGAGDRAGAAVIYPVIGDVTPPPPPPPPPTPVDVTPPVSVATVSPSGWTRGPVTFAMSATDSGSGVRDMLFAVSGSTSQPYVSPVSLSSEGITPITYWSVDLAGNVESPKTIEARVDRTPPSVTSDAGSGYVGEAIVRISASDALSGVTSVSYRVDGGPSTTVYGPGAIASVTTPGTHTIEFSATDAAGNSASEAATIVVAPRDIEAPVTTAQGVPSDWTSSTVTVSLATAGGDVAATYYRLGEGPTLAYSAPIVIDAEGETVLRFWSTDRVGNVEAPRTAIVRIDRTPPVAICSPEAVYRDSAKVCITASDARSGVRLLSWSLDGDEWRSGTTSEATIETARAGLRRLSYLCADAAGNVTAGSASFVLMKSAVVVPARPLTAMTLTRRRGIVTTNLGAVVRYADGAPIPRATATLQRSGDGRRWTTVARLSTSATGSVSKRVTFKTPGVTYWRWRLASNSALGHDAATSRTVKLRVR